MPPFPPQKKCFDARETWRSEAASIPSTSMRFSRSVAVSATPCILASSIFLMALFRRRLSVVRASRSSSSIDCGPALREAGKGGSGQGGLERERPRDWKGRQMRGVVDAGRRRVIVKLGRGGEGCVGGMREGIACVRGGGGGGGGGMESTSVTPRSWSAKSANASFSFAYTRNKGPEDANVNGRASGNLREAATRSTGGGGGGGGEVDESSPPARGRRSGGSPC